MIEREHFRERKACTGHNQREIKGKYMSKYRDKKINVRGGGRRYFLILT